MNWIRDNIVAIVLVVLLVLLCVNGSPGLRGIGCQTNVEAPRK